MDPQASVTSLKNVKELHSNKDWILGFNINLYLVIPLRTTRGYPYHTLRTTDVIDQGVHNTACKQ